MRIEDVRYVLAVVDEANLTRAAMRVHVSPPAMSEAIRRVEDLLGTQLFERSNRGMALNEAGRRLVPHLRAVADAATELEEASGNASHELGSPLRVGTMLGYGSTVLQELIDEPLDLGDGARLAIEMGVFDWADPTAGLRGGESDVAIVAGPTDFDEHLVSAHLGFEPRYAVFSHRHPLADKESVTLADMDAIGWLSIPCPDEVWSSFMYLEGPRRGPVPLSTRSPCHTPQEVALALHNGEGVLSSPLELAQHFAVRGDVFRPISGVDGIPFRAAYVRGHDSPLIDRLIAVLAARLPPEPGDTALVWTDRKKVGAPLLRSSG